MALIPINQDLLGKSKKKNTNKIENDKYYTPRDLAKRLIDKTFEIIGTDNITDIIEPSAGNALLVVS